jgi:phosphoglycerol transferase MdoB-like AlkP superfamily enzyme
LTRVVERWREWSDSFRAGRLETFSFSISLGLCLLALGLGLLSLDAGATALARDSFVNVIVPGVEEAEEDNPATVPTVEGAEEPEENDSDTAPGVGQPAAHATLAQTSQTEKRNVVLVHLESTRARSVTPYNEDLKTTPFLDELAKQSLLVEQAYVGSIPRSLMSSISVNCGIQPPPG